MLSYARILNESRGDLVENPLKVGEVVKLKRGGPVMTVSIINEVEEVVRVVWHGKSGEVQSQDFSPELLQRAGRRFFGRRR
jgi:uncharacterized protein YodC (DUF2158 family)